MTVSIEKCDVCIVGAGLAGMNALFVASRYLSRDQRVILVDRRRRVGGMWVDTYPYVRLHQPHSMFTAGNVKWTSARPPAHLASKNEVLGHFDHCLNVLRRRLWVDEFFGYTHESDDEGDGVVRLTLRSAEGNRVVVEAGRLIKAYGFQVEPNDPLPVSSPRVRSVSPDPSHHHDSDVRESDAPVWIIGGGKTAMDTAHQMIAAHPGREVNLVAGSGTFFLDRDAFFPTKARRWWTGTMLSALMTEVARRFDGTNEADLWEWQRNRYALAATPTVGNFLGGFLSGAERDVIVAGLNEVVMDHFCDVVDADDGPRMTLRSGATRAVEPGSWIVNCTGYLTGRRFPYEPYASPNGSVLSVQMSSATMHLTAHMAYFGAHLLLSGALRKVPLYELDALELYERSHTAFPFALMTLVGHNLSLCADSLPTKAFTEFGLDLDRWYPLPRRAMAMVKFMRNHRSDRKLQRRALDVVRERFDVRCGPLTAT